MAKPLKPKKVKDFASLQKEWYGKLKNSGFEDIETTDGRLKEYSSTLLANPHKVLTQNGGWQAKEEYYRMAGHFLLEHKFETKLKKVMWEYHSNGISVEDIAKTLNKTGVVKTNRTSVWQIIKDLRTIMFGRYLQK